MKVRFFTGLFLLAAGLPLNSHAKVRFSQTHRESEARKSGALVFQAAGSPAQALLMLSFAPISETELRTVANEVSKEPNWPSMSLSHDEIFLNGQATGVRFVSYAPVQLKRQKRTWTYDGEASFEKNHEALKAFLAPPPAHASLFDQLIPSAQAGEGLNFVGSALMLTEVPIFLMTLANPEAWPVAAGWGAIAAGAYGYKKLQDYRENKKLYAAASGFMQSNVKVTCSSDLVEVKSVSPNPEMSLKITIDKHEIGTGNAISVTTSPTLQPMYNNYPQEQRQGLEALASSCKNEEDAAKLTEKWNAGVKKLGRALATESPASTSSSNTGANPGSDPAR